MNTEKVANGNLDSGSNICSYLDYKNSRCSLKHEPIIPSLVFYILNNTESARINLYDIFEKLVGEDEVLKMQEDINNPFMIHAVFRSESSAIKAREYYDKKRLPGVILNICSEEAQTTYTERVDYK